MGLYAEIEARRFSRSELHEFLSVWFPRTAAFAVMRGGSLSAVVPQDPAMDLVGTFYIRLELWERERWDAFFTGDGTMRERAKGVDLSVQGLYDWKDVLMERLGRKFASGNSVERRVAVG
jgi:hypothetical protein